MNSQSLIAAYQLLYIMVMFVCFVVAYIRFHENVNGWSKMWHLAECLAFGFAALSSILSPYATYPFSTFLLSLPFLAYSMRSFQKLSETIRFDAKAKMQSELPRWVTFLFGRFQRTTKPSREYERSKTRH